jgi:uncharacterized membrane protein YebE (DUF533 family)
MVLADFDKPLTPAALAKLASDPMLAAQLYAAAVVGAGDVAAAERAWLDEFAKALKLDSAAAAAGFTIERTTVEALGLCAACRERAA